MPELEQLHLDIDVLFGDRVYIDARPLPDSGVDRGDP